MTIRRFVNNEIVSGELPYVKVNNKQVMSIIRKVNMKIRENEKRVGERQILPIPKSC